MIPPAEMRRTKLPAEQVRVGDHVNGYMAPVRSIDRPPLIAGEPWGPIVLHSGYPGGEDFPMWEWPGDIVSVALHDERHELSR